MNIAIIDDLPRELSRISEIITEYASKRRLSVDLKTFQSAEDLLAGYRPLQYTLIFMDIYMDGMNGVGAAKKIREIDRDTLIVFLTTSQEHAFDAFDVHAYQYLLKSPDDAVMRQSVYRVMNEVSSMTRPAAERKLSFSADGEEKSVPFSEIVYALSEKNYVQIVDRAQNSYRTRATFSELNSILGKDSRFLQINRGVIINMDCITAFEKGSCELCGGYRLPVNVREQKKLDQIRKNYVFSKLHGWKNAKIGGETNL